MIIPMFFILTGFVYKLLICWRFRNKGEKCLVFSYAKRNFQPTTTIKIQSPKPLVFSLLLMN